MFCVSDVVVSFVKKTVSGIAGLLRLHKPLTHTLENPQHYEEVQGFVYTTCHWWRELTVKHN